MDTSGENEGGTGLRRRDSFLPEESFQSWGNYGKALKETPARLIDRVLTRSGDAAELEVKARSNCQMKKTLNWWDLMWLGLGSLIGAGIFVLTGQEAKQHSGPAVVVSYAIAGVSALLSVFCYTEFAVEIPVAGGSFSYLRVELGDFIAFIGGGNIILEYIIGCAAVARSWTSYFATLCNRDSTDAFRIHTSLPEGYNLLDPISVAVIALICVIVVLSTKGSSRLNYIASIVHMIIILFIVVAGLTKANFKNLQPFIPMGINGVFSSSAVLFFAYIGFDAVSTMAEETKDPPKDIPLGLVGAMVITTAIYCLLALTLVLMQPYKEIDVNAPFSKAFAEAGMSWAKYIVAFGALKGMTSMLLVSAVGQARYLTHIARTHMVPHWFAEVNPKTGTPIRATVTMLFATALVSFFTDLQILANLLSISILFLFMLVAISLLVRRYYVSNQTSAAERNKLICCLTVMILSSVACSGYYWGGSKSWVGYCVILPIWLLSIAGLKFLVPMARKARLWGAPLVPWLPSLSIFINIFLLGSIDMGSYIRFGIWTVLLLIYYVLFGLHASYDTAKHEDGKVTAIEEGKNPAPKS